MFGWINFNHMEDMKDIFNIIDPDSLSYFFISLSVKSHFHSPEVCPPVSLVVDFTVPHTAFFHWWGSLCISMVQTTQKFVCVCSRYPANTDKQPLTTALPVSVLFLGSPYTACLDHKGTLRLRPFLVPQLSNLT